MVEISLILFQLQILLDVYKRQTCTFPPPVAPPFIPKTGPKEGSLNAKIDFLFIFLNPSAIAIEMCIRDRF